MPNPYIKEVAVRYTRRRLKTPDSLIGAPLHSAREVAHLFRFLADEPRETLVVVHIDGRNTLTTWERISVGSSTTSIAHPKSVFQAALLKDACAVVLIHNHPSGKPDPSAEDDAITARMAACGHLMGIPLLDHVVVASDGYYSYRESNPDLLEAGS